MLRKIILWKLAAVERELGVPIDYLRHILRVSLPAFLKFGKILPLAEYRRVLPHDARHVGLLVASREEDCGTCLQIGVNVARKDGVPADVVRAVVERRTDDLPPDLADVARFTEAVVRATYDEDELRERLRARHGEEGLVELAMAIAACRVFPITKRALGYAKSCSRVDVRID